MLTHALILGAKSDRLLGEDLLESIRQMNAGLGTVVYSPIIAARQNAGLSPAQFAELLGASVRTLQEWEQGRRQPSGAAKTLLRVAQRHPEVLRELAEA
ncbi:helix-turn-helix domain-containing protein [Lamprocystis purpurea]|uniref:helix-turn-helix domain-containing protein n=1 Tax=Lamprocystis purpurea TaxID=61598 RepID=UPI0005909F1A|nr:type II toxin-antitoxin system MqsA family antitoxin [Lamprocystis purpurea]